MSEFPLPVGLLPRNDLVVVLPHNYGQVAIWHGTPNPCPCDPYIPPGSDAKVIARLRWRSFATVPEVDLLGEAPSMVPDDRHHAFSDEVWQP